MKIFDVKLGSGFLFGAGIVVLAPIITPLATSLLRSLAKLTIKGGLIAYHQAKIATAEAMESLEDLTAEAKAEVAEEPKAESAKKSPEHKAEAAKK